MHHRIPSAINCDMKKIGRPGLVFINSEKNDFFNENSVFVAFECEKDI